MSLFVLGLNHRTAPIELRECLHLSEEGRKLAMEQFRREGGLQGCVVLSTCNRFEIYGSAVDPEAAIQRVADLIRKGNTLPVGTLWPHLYHHIGQPAAVHLMRVAASLDSMMLGEAQILGQVGQANRSAQEMESNGPVLQRLFEMAVRAGKRAHTETAIGEHTVSISHAAVTLAVSVLDHLEISDVRACVVGAGKMSSLAIDALHSAGIERVDVANRTEVNARALAEAGGGRAYGWHELQDALANADIVISATGAPHTVIHEPDVEIAMRERRNRPMVLIDTAVPRDVGDGVNTVPDVYFYNIDDLHQVVDENHAKRASCVPAVECIINQEVTQFMEWYHSRTVVPVIKGLRQKVQAIATSELDAALNQLSEEDRALVTKMVHRIVNKVLHEPTVQLRQQAALGGGEVYVQAVQDLFALNFEEAEAHG